MWIDPKTNWTREDVPLPEDFNRIEGNVRELEGNVRELKEKADVGNAFVFAGNGSYSGVPFERNQNNTDGDRWLAIGPSEWPALSLVPSGARGVKVNVLLRLVPLFGEKVTLFAYVKKRGAAIPALETQPFLICYAAGEERCLGHTVDVPLNSERQIDVLWYVSTSQCIGKVQLYLTGWYI